MNPESTIAAISSPAGAGATAIVRMSGSAALEVADGVFMSPHGKKLAQQKPYTMHYGRIVHDGQVLDEVIAAVFRAPHSYTGENTVEIYCHGSVYIQRQILQALIENGATMAEPGEFTLRAFLNKKIDLAQAEAVAALISAQTQATHCLAMQQMRGGYSAQMKLLRQQLLHFLSLVELELDFAEEDIEFADRPQMLALIDTIIGTTEALIRSFAVGSAIKDGVPVAIGGKPNVGKSTLFNTLLCEERVLVSPIAGTTRDAIEAAANIGGILFRFVDTAGLRTTADGLEQMSIERSIQKIGQARIVLWVADCTEPADTITADILQLSTETRGLVTLSNTSGGGQQLIVLLNKTDLLPTGDAVESKVDSLRTVLGSAVPIIPISGKCGNGLDVLQTCLMRLAALPENMENNCIVSSVRHYEALAVARSSLINARDAILHKIGGELIAFEARKAIDCIGSIVGVGSITDADVLNNIFGKFCVGK